MQLYDVIVILLLYTGNIWWGKILANHAGKSYILARKKIWQISNSQCICIYIFHVSANIGKVNFDEWLTNSPIFPLPKFSVYGISNVTI